MKLHLKSSTGMMLGSDDSSWAFDGYNVSVVTSFKNFFLKASVDRMKTEWEKKSNLLNFKLDYWSFNNIAIT